MINIGIVFGCFIPMHKGHESLITRALEENDKIILAVCGYQTDRGRDFIDFETRIRLVTDMFKDRTWTDRVFHVYSVGIIFAGKIYFTPDREICTMKIKVFFHGDFSEKTSVRIQLYIALYHLTKPPYQTVECHYTMKPQAVI